MKQMCIVCNGRSAKTRLQWDDDHIKTYDIYKCQNCGLEFVFPMYTAEEFYDYFSKYKDFRADNEALKKTAVKKIKDLEKYGITKKNKLLDYGCGKNLFVKEANTNNWFGYDKYASFQDSMIKDYHRQQWDFITLWGVLACLSDPVNTMKELVACLKKEGKFIFSDIWIEGPIPFQYRYEHVTYWTLKAVEILFNKIGLKIIDHHPYKMIQKTNIYLECVLRTVPEEYMAKIYHDLPEYIEVPTNEIFVVGLKS